MALPRAVAERRLTDLERLVAAQHNKLGCLARQLGDLADCIEALRAGQKLLRADHAALCSTVQTTGVRLPGDCSVAVDRQLAERRDDILKSVLQTPELSLAIGRAASINTARSLCTTAVEHGQGMRIALPSLVAQSIPDIYVCGGARDEVVTATVERFVEGCKWETVPPMPTPRCRCAAAAIDGLLYVFGGRARGLALSTLECFDPQTNTWQSLPPMTTARDGCAAVANSDGFLYVFGGGLPGAVAVSTAERYHPTTGTWEELPPMGTARDGCVAAASRSILYVFGGYDGVTDLATAECFDPATRRWEDLPPMSSARDACATAACRGMLYVFGGYGVGQALFTAERFDPERRQWSSVPDMPTARDGCAATSASGKLYVFGGYGVGQALAAAECFNPETNLWEQLLPMPTARDACACAALLV